MLIGFDQSPFMAEQLVAMSHEAHALIESEKGPML
jgi:hypothetical protein